jgi:hypothetical protein
MGTKNYEKGYGCVGFNFRRFLVEELQDSELNYFWNFRWWRRHEKDLDRLWSGSSIFRNFLGFFWKGEKGLHSCVHLPGACTVFYLAQLLVCTFSLSNVGFAWHCSMNRLFHPSVLGKKFEARVRWLRRVPV